MAYNNYFPQYYPGAMPTPAPQQANGINWVVGENEAKIFPETVIKLGAMFIYILGMAPFFIHHLFNGRMTT